MIEQYGVKEVVFVKIKNWFDHKWLNYSGNTVVHFNASMPGLIDTAKKSVWREQITVPPFHPNRILSSKFFRPENTGNPRIEKRINKYQFSNDNIHNRIKDYTSDGLVIWFSSNSDLNKKGSVMAYRIQSDEVITWYATLEEKDGWHITKSKGIALDDLKESVQAQG